MIKEYSILQKLRTISTEYWVFATGLIFAITGVIELLLGRVAMCTCGYIKFWEGNNNSSGNSQHIADFYTFSHVIHGFVFYYLLWKFGKKLPFGLKLVIALLVEAGWEILENSPLIIDRYRAATISLNYYGDSVLNSLFDIAFMLAGFYLARKLPVWAIIGLTILMEVAVGYLIRDNLTLNIIMLIYPLQAIKNWQMGG